MYMQEHYLYEESVDFTKPSNIKAAIEQAVSLLRKTWKDFDSGNTGAGVEGLRRTVALLERRHKALTKAYAIMKSDEEAKAKEAEAAKATKKKRAPRKKSAKKKASKKKRLVRKKRG